MHRILLKASRYLVLLSLLAWAWSFYTNPPFVRKPLQAPCGPTLVIMRALAEAGFGYAAVFEDLGHNVFALYVNDKTGDWRMVEAKADQLRACIATGGRGWLWWWR